MAKKVINKRAVGNDKPMAGRWVFASTYEDARASIIGTLADVEKNTLKIRSGQKLRKVG